ncbi:MAG: hypothetical protein HC859_10715 [Bacteroidia bacterium]|nr:hypothetical protein [Bacteroidia bacterium]
MRIQFFALPVVIALLAACVGGSKHTYQFSEPALQPSPAGAQSLTPYLFVDARGAVHMSWVEKDDSLHRLKTATLNEGTWTAAVEIAADTNWFVNWADYPMMITDGGQRALAHMLRRSGEGYAYDVQLFSTNGQSAWSTRGLLNNDATKSEHGFVSMVPWNGNILVTWLDGRNSAADTASHADNHGHHGAMSIRAAVIDYDGRTQQEWELDARTCDCCQTTIALLAGTPTVLYRDRSDSEVRDVFSHN